MVCSPCCYVEPTILSQPLNDQDLRIVSNTVAEASGVKITPTISMPTAAKWGNHMSRESEFDFVIVGAGTAGCMLANGLSENPAHRVVLLSDGGMEIVNW